MRDAVRLAITMMVIGIISAALLTGVNGVTEPIIAERQRLEHLRTLEQYFPGMERFESRTVDGESYDLVYGRRGELLGVMATVNTREGYGGEITYNLAVDEAGTIIGLKVISHSETPGTGDVIETPEFQERLIGKGIGDPFQDGVDVDVISGATVSSLAMIDSARRALESIAAHLNGGER